MRRGQRGEAKRVSVEAARAVVRLQPADSTKAPPRRRWGRWPVRAGIAALAAVYMLTWGIISLLDFNPTDLDAFFLPAVRIALAGHPLLVYTMRLHVVGLVYPNANGPLSLVPLTAVAALAAHLGWLDNPDLRRMLVMTLFSAFALLMAWEGVAAIDRLRGAPLRGVGRVLAYGLFASAPTLWHGMLLYGHIELPIMLWLTLFSVRTLVADRPGQAGLALGLAVLDRSMAVLYLLPLLLLLITHWRWRAALWLGGSATATVALGLLPFWLADRNDLIFSLVTFRGPLPVGGGSIWFLALGTRYEPLAQRFDGAAVLAAGVLVGAIVVLARRDLRPTARDLYGLLALSGLCFPFLIKTTWPYYFLDAYVFLLIWWLGGARPARKAVRWLGILLPLFFVGCALLAEYGVEQDLNWTLRRQESGAMAALLAGFILGFGAWLLAWRRAAVPAHQGLAAAMPTALDGSRQL
jgi:hypothetical protein